MSCAYDDKNLPEEIDCSPGGRLCSHCLGTSLTPTALALGAQEQLS